jgi:hypothetical protein
VVIEAFVSEATISTSPRFSVVKPISISHQEFCFVLSRIDDITSFCGPSSQSLSAADATIHASAAASAALSSAAPTVTQWRIEAVSDVPPSTGLR